MNEEKGCASLGCNTTKKNDFTVARREELNWKQKQNVRGWFEAESFCAICGVMPVVRADYKISLLNKGLPWPCDCFYMISFYENNLIEH